MPQLKPLVNSVFPTKRYGAPDFAVPIEVPLIRLVFGDYRGTAPAIEWQIEPPSDAIHLRCSSSGKESFDFNAPSRRAVFDSWVDFSAPKLSRFQLFFSLFADDGDARVKNAQCCILGDEMRDLIGLIRRPMLDSSGNLVAVLTISFLVVKPFVTPFSSYPAFHSLTSSCRMSSESLNLSWFTGHRGMGKTKPDLPRENTVHSFIESTAHDDVSTVELDVQLTKDGQTLVYHDWFFRKSGRDKDEDRSNLAVAPYCLRLREFQQLYASGVREEPCISSSTSNPAITGRSTDTDVRFALASDVARTLAQVCIHLPEDIGLMVEVKYPAPAVQGNDNIAYPERNELVDKILHDLFSVASNARRTILFLSFDPDIALLLALKQSVFPVYFSHCGGIDPPCEIEDPRCVDISQGVNFAAINGMQGMLYFEKLLRESYAPYSASSALPAAIELAKEKGLSVVTYGSENSEAVWASKQIRMGVDSVIADRVKDLARECAPLIGEGKVAQKRKTKEPKMFERNDLNEINSREAPKFVDYDLFT